MAQMTKAFPDKAFSGIGGIATFDHALSYFLLGCGTAQVCTAAMLDHAIGPNVIKGLLSGMTEFMEKRGYASLEDFRGIRRDRVVPQERPANALLGRAATRRTAARRTIAETPPPPLPRGSLVGPAPGGRSRGFGESERLWRLRIARVLHAG